MNVLLANCEEWVDGAFCGNLGDVLIRCNNVLYMRGAPADDMQSDAAASIAA